MIEQIQDIICFLSLGIAGFVIVGLELMLLILIIASYLLSFEIIVTNEDFIRTLVIKLIAWGWTLFDWHWILLKAIMGGSKVLLAIVLFGYVISLFMVRICAGINYLLHNAKTPIFIYPHCLWGLSITNKALLPDSGNKAFILCSIKVASISQN